MMLFLEMKRKLWSKSISLGSLLNYHFIQLHPEGGSEMGPGSVDFNQAALCHSDAQWC